MNLPKIKNDDPALQLMQDKWAAILNPLLSQPISSNNFLQNIPIVTGNNTINHLLSRKQQGWIITDQDGFADIARNMPFNDKTLTLVSSGPCNISLLVF